VFSNILSHQRVAIANFSNRESAIQAFDHLVLSGFPLAQLFLLDQDLGHGSDHGSDHDSDHRSDHRSEHSNLPAVPYGCVMGTATGLKKGALLGNLIGGTSGVLLGVGLIALPGVGQLMLGSAIAFILLSGGACSAAGGLTGAFIGLGLTSKQAQSHAQQIAKGRLLLVVEGTARDIEHAHYLLKNPCPNPLV
jgi:hypothetical protein